MILDFLLVLARKLWLNYLTWNNSTKRGGHPSSQKLLKKKKTKQKQKQNQTIIWPYLFIVFRKKKNNKRYWIVRNHLSWHSLNLQMLQKWLEENMEMHVAQKHRKNNDKALAYSYSDIRSYEREQKCLTFSITIRLYLLWFLQDGVLVWIFPSLSGGFRLCFPSSKHLNSHLHFSLRLK